MNKTNKKKHKTSIGGQALIEGIVMLGPKGAAMSIRLPDGTIETENKKVKRLRDKYKVLGLPLIRGVVNFAETMIFGYKCTMESAEKSALAEDEDIENGSKLDRWLSEHFDKKMMTALSVIAAIVGLALAFIMFLWMPSFVVDFIDEKLANGTLVKWHPALEGVIRMIIFVIYIALISMMQEIKRVFMYHGAEHKAIFCYESGEELTIENVKKQSRFHPRCGTSFIFVMLILSILVSSSINLIFPSLQSVSRPLWITVRLLLLPLIIGVGYEFIKYAGKHENLFTRILSAPGLWMQRLTTKEPSEDIIEVALTALTEVITDNPEDDAI